MFLENQPFGSTYDNKYLYLSLKIIQNERKEIFKHRADVCKDSDLEKRCQPIITKFTTFLEWIIFSALEGRY